MKRHDSDILNTAQGTDRTKGRRWRSALLFVLAFLFTFLFTSQARQIRSENLELEEIRRSYAYYATLLEEQTDRQERLDEQVLSLSAQLYDEYDRILKEVGEEDLLREWQTARALAGFTEVRGEGVVITLNDAQNVETLTSVNIVHDTDVQYVVDSLRTFGAQAVAINGERILHTSKLTCNGPTILINRTFSPVPYVIRAVGDADRIYEFFQRDSRMLRRSLDGIMIRIEKQDAVTIPGYQDMRSVAAQTDLLEVN